MKKFKSVEELYNHYQHIHLEDQELTIYLLIHACIIGGYNSFFDKLKNNYAFGLHLHNGYRSGFYFELYEKRDDYLDERIAYHISCCDNKVFIDEFRLSDTCTVYELKVRLQMSNMLMQAKELVEKIYDK